MDTNVVPSWIKPLQIEFQTGQKEFSIFAKKRFSAKNLGPYYISNYINSILYQWKQHCRRHVITQPHCKVLTLAQLKREHPEVDFDGWYWTRILSHFTMGCGSESFQLSNKKQYTKNWWYFWFFHTFLSVPWCSMYFEQKLTSTSGARTFWRSMGSKFFGPGPRT